MTTDFGSIRHTLNARLAELTGRIARIEQEQREPLDDDFAEQVVDREDDAALDALEDAALTEAGAIRQALDRLNAGTYGLCTACGNQITLARLEALPSAALCMNCAAQG